MKPAWPNDGLKKSRKFKGLKKHQIVKVDAKGGAWFEDLKLRSISIRLPKIGLNVMRIAVINLMSILGLVLLQTEMLISMSKGKEILKLIKNNNLLMYLVNI